MIDSHVFLAAINLRFLRILGASSLFAFIIVLVCLTPALAQTTIKVTTNKDEFNDDGDCSLREAIWAANLDQAISTCAAGHGTDTISLPPGEYVLTIAGIDENAAQTGDLDLTANVIIQGEGQTKPIINGNHLDRVFDIAFNTTLTLANVIITGGDLTSGGGMGGGLMLRSNSALILNNSQVQGNTASLGGGIFGDLDSTITLNNSRVAGNTTTFGGGIYANLNTVALNNSQVIDNEAAIDGGGLYTFMGQVTLTNSQVNGNTGDNGGGINSSASILTLTNSQVDQNSADSNGGGINVDSGSTVNLINSLVDRNSADSDGGLWVNESMVVLTQTEVISNTGDFGGGILVKSNSTFNLADSQVNGNVGMFGGGGIETEDTNTKLTIINSQVNDNIGGPVGGGLFIKGNSILTFTHSQMQGNSASNGGGIFVFSDSALVTMTHSRVISNFADRIGGGIALDRGFVKLTHSQVTHNTSNSDGGGVYVDAGRLELLNSTVSGNFALEDGGGLYIFEGVTADFYNVTLANNTADADADEAGQGGGVYLDSAVTTLTVANTIIAHNVDLSSPGNQHPDCSGPLASAGYNLIEDVTGCLIGGNVSTDLTGLDPMLGPLDDNGGDTLTHALLAGSPAIDAGNPAGCLDSDGLPLTTDQRDYGGWG